MCNSTHMVKMQSAPASRYSELVNEEVKALMARRGFTQVKLAEAVGISQPRASRMIFKNEFSMPISILERIAAALSDSPSEILRRASQALEKEQAEAIASKAAEMRRNGYALAAKEGTLADVRESDCD